MKIKYITPVVIAFLFIFAFTYGASALYKKTITVEDYYADKQEKSKEEYDNIIYKKQIIAKKIRYEKEQERIKQEKIIATKKLNKKLAIEKADKKRVALQNTNAEKLRQQNRAKQNAIAFAEEKARLERVAAEKKIKAAEKKKKSRRSRAS